MARRAIVEPATDDQPSRVRCPVCRAVLATWEPDATTGRVAGRLTFVRPMTSGTATLDASRHRGSTHGPRHDRTREVWGLASSVVTMDVRCYVCSARSQLGPSDVEAHDGRTA